MGKKKKMNRLISRWIKSDLPDDRSPVLLLGVAKIPTSPKPIPRGLFLTTAAVPSVALQNREQHCDKAIAKKKFVVTPCPENTIHVAEVPSLESTTITSTMDPKDATTTAWSDLSSTVEPSKSSVTPSETRLPSYLSLACTVNGYSATTNYDPDRLARSRDTSPHRPFGHHTNPDGLTYAVCNNLLSPPNLVPLPPLLTNLAQNSAIVGSDMSENGLAVTNNSFRHEYHPHQHHNHNTSHHQQQQLNNNNNNNSLKSTYNNVPPSVDSVDACADNGFKVPVVIEPNGKSFIQQRVERLYGPGALAQGFFVMKKQRRKSYENEHIVHNGQRIISERHSKSMNEQSLLDDGEDADSDMKQTSSTPSLPVLRHLRPEFRAQLPITVNKRRADHNTPQQKIATTIPTLLEEERFEGQILHDTEMNCGFITDSKTNGGNNKKKGGGNDVCDRIRPHHSQKHAVKDGHYFIIVLEKETKRLLSLAIKAEEELECVDLDENAKGFLRSAAGKARLLVSQKMQQFRGLCRNNLTQVADEAFPTTNEDLQGFWDMLMLQVHQIDDLFSELDIMRENNWQEQCPVSSVSSTTTNGRGGSSRKLGKVPSRPISAVAEENRKLREIQRKKMIEEKRRAMKEQLQRGKTSRQSIEIYVPESS